MIRSKTKIRDGDKREKEDRRKQIRRWLYGKSGEAEEVKYTVEYLTDGVREQFAQALRENPYRPGMGREELERRVEQKKELRMALRQSVLGGKKAKIYMKDHIKEILFSRYHMEEERIEESIPFQSAALLSAGDKFQILLFCYRQRYGKKAMEVFLETHFLPRREINWITEEEIHEIYEKEMFYKLSFSEKMEILSQRIYQHYKGFGVIDELRELEIDGISAGVSGLGTEELEEKGGQIWIFYHGKNICLRFLEFESQKERIRVCRNIYRYRSPGQLSEKRGYIVNEMEDGSRISVCRPPFSEDWAFFIRKFDTMQKKSMKELVTDRESYIPVMVMKWLVKGCQVTGITGEQGAGKTTLLMALTGYIPVSYNLRVQELAFELHLRSLYPERNILSFRETDSITGQEGLDFQKKTDGTVYILGEVASLEVSAWLVQMAQAASRFTLFTHHAKTADTLVASLRNALLQKGGFQDETMAAMQVVEAVRFDIHMAKTISGHRYIERITELVPGYETGGKEIYRAQDIVCFKNGSYQKKHKISERSSQEICKGLREEEQEVFFREMKDWGEICV